MQELPFLHSARRLMLVDICMKFREDSLRNFQVTERTRFVTDRRTDRRPGKNNMSPNPSGGDITMNVIENRKKQGIRLKIVTMIMSPTGNNCHHDYVTDWQQLSP